MIKIELKNNFNLDSTVTCGQIFRYYKLEDNSYDIILKDRVINVYKKDNYIIASSNNEDDLEIVVKNYFDLDNDYENINKYLLEKDSLLKDAIMFSCGLMMIRQDPFETLIEYIISANNGVPNITSALNNIAKRYGKKVLFNKKEYYLFPSYKDLKDVTKEDFRECKVGFRDKYLESIVYKLNNNIINLDDFNKLDSNEAMDKLMENNGIGPKVASCILLFAYQRYDVFPVDTWVKKIMESNYNIIGEKNIREFASKTYGKYSALAIQYLFNYSRNKSN